jgi:hypothetical protein
MSDIDFDGLRGELLAAITAINAAKTALKDDFSDRSVYARVDLGHIARDLTRGMHLLDNTEKILKGNN